jgi:hypothetical protein
MPTSYIAVTRARDLQALGTGGQLAIEAASTLAALLSRELSPAHAALFAEPHPNPARGEVDWYAEGEGPVAPLAEIPEPERAAVQAELDRLVGDIRRLSERLRTSARESDRFLGEMLALALEVPDAGSIRVRGGRPVLVAWGHTPAGGRAGPDPIRGVSARAVAPMAIRPAPPLPIAPGPRLWPWLAALVGAGAVFVASLLLLLTDPFGWLSKDIGVCRLPESDLAALRAYRDEEQREATLRAELAAVVDDAGKRRLSCPPVPAPVRRSEDGERNTRQPDEGRRATENGGQRSAENDMRRAQERGARSGKLEIVLAWDDRNDLDLHVFCPDGQELYFQARSACGGTLDVDANRNPEDATATPVENAVWETPPPGRYRIVVDPYAMRDHPASRFRVTIRQDGKADRTVEGTATADRHGETAVEVEIPQS